MDHASPLLIGGERPKGALTAWLLASTLMGAMGAFQFGYIVAIVNVPQVTIEKALGLEHNGTGWSLIVSATSFAAIFGAQFSAGPLDKWGRRLFLVAVNALFIVGGALSIVAGYLAPRDHVAAQVLVLLSRLIFGVGVGGCSAAVPMYLGEIAPLHLKGSFGALNQFTLTCSILLGQGLGVPMGTPGAWGWLLGLPAFFGAIVILAAPLLVESPRWLLAQGRRDEAVSVLERLRGYGLEAAEAEAEEMMPSGGAAAEPSLSLLALLRHPVFAWPTAIACFLQLAQQLSGINAVFFYSTSFFVSAGVSNATAATILAGAVNVLGTGLGMWAIDRAGRKPLLLVGALGMGVSCLVITALQVLKAAGKGGADAEGYSIVVVILAYVVFFELGMGSIPWLIAGEMLPEAPRATAMGVAAAVNWVFTTVIGLGFPPVSKALGNYAFVPFAGVLVVTFFFTLKWVPETKGRTPEQVLAWIATGSYDAALPKQLRGGDYEEGAFLSRGGLQ